MSETKETTSTESIGAYRHIVPAFHGTSSVRATKILADGFDLTQGKDGWFGAGAYFWESDWKLTRVHAKKAVKGDVTDGHSSACPAYLEARIGMDDDWLDLTTQAGRSFYVSEVPRLIRKVPALREQFAKLHAERCADRVLLRTLFEVIEEEMKGVRAFTGVSDSHYELENLREVTMMKFPVQLPGNGPHLVSRALEGIGIQVVVKRNPKGSVILGVEEHHGEL